MSQHTYKTEGSDRKHGALRMIGMCTCGWQGQAVEGQDNHSRELSKIQWEQHMSKIQNPDDFLQGQRDCQAGIPHKPNMSTDYDRGYLVEYEREQVMTELSLRRTRHG